MNKLLQFEKDGVSILVEVDPGRAGVAPMSTTAPDITKASQSLENSLEVVTKLGEALSGTLARTGAESAQVSLGLKFTAEGNIFVVKTSGEATLGLTLTYGRAKPSTG